MRDSRDRDLWRERERKEWEREREKSGGEREKSGGEKKRVGEREKRVGERERERYRELVKFKTRSYLKRKVDQEF